MNCADPSIIFSFSLILACLAQVEQMVMLVNVRLS